MSQDEQNVPSDLQTICKPWLRRSMRTEHTEKQKTPYSEV